MSQDLWLPEAGGRGISDSEVDISATGPRRFLVLMLLLLGILIQCSVTVKRRSDFINS